MASIPYPCMRDAARGIVHIIKEKNKKGKFEQCWFVDTRKIGDIMLEKTTLAENAQSQKNKDKRS